MFQLTYRHLLSLALAAVSATFINAQTSKSFTPGTKIQVQNCQKVEMKALEAGRLEILANPSLGSRVMGYTDEAVPVGVEIPSNMQHWLENVEQGAAYVEAHPELKMGSASEAKTYPRISPLLGDIEWNQSYPWDQYCPSGTPVGCVATAMAQVVRYWKYPDQCRGSHTWEWDGTTHHVDFDSVAYNWDLMFGSYNRWATQAQMDEVARLSYHCGVSINMMWAPEGSGTYTQFVPSALKEHFGYNDRAQCVPRNCYTHDEWEDLLIDELLAGRPVIFSGSNDESGHAFVIDGLDIRGYFHVNWGWGGYYNGYFDICILNPTGTGIGATDSELGFCMDQEAAVQICPEQGVGELISPLKSAGIWTNHNSRTIVSSAYLENYTGDTLRGVPAMQVYDSLDQVVQIDFGDTITTYPFGTWEYYTGHIYYGELTVYTDVDSLANGAYYLKPCYLSLGADTVLYEVPTKVDQNPRIDFTVEGGMIKTFQEHISEGNVFEGSHFSHHNQELAVGRTYDATIDVVNRGNDLFFGYFSLVIQTAAGRKTDMDPIMSRDVQIMLQPGDSLTVTFPLSIEKTGNWRALLRAYNYNMGQRMDDCHMDSVMYFSTAFNEDSPAALTLTEAAQLLTERCEAGGEIEFQFIVNNKGGRFSDRIGMEFYTGKTTSGNPVFEVFSEGEVEMNVEADTVIVKGMLTEAKGMKKYYALPYYRDANGVNQRMMIEGADGSSTSPTAIEVRVYNASGIETITVDDTDAKAPVYDLWGRRVQGQSGILIQNRRKIVR